MFGGLDEMEKHLLGVEEDDRPTTCRECGHNVVDSINHMVENGHKMHLLIKTGDALAKAVREGRDATELAKEWEQTKKELIG